MEVCAGLLIYDQSGEELKVFLVHPGGPYWEKKQDQGWGIPKGKVEDKETLWDAAWREAREELGQEPNGTATFYLDSIKQNSKKRVHCFAFEGSVDEPVRSNHTEIEWPKGSGKMVSAPEIDKGAWFTIDEAKPIIIRKQFEFLERLKEKLEAGR